VSAWAHAPILPAAIEAAERFPVSLRAVIALAFVAWDFA
jgi:hypothetical protein